MTVFPTPVGVFLLPAISGLEKSGLPHARGGVSSSCNLWSRKKWSSPRPWGCFSSDGITSERFPVFPTPVGVFPT